MMYWSSKSSWSVSKFSSSPTAAATEFCFFIRLPLFSVMLLSPSLVKVFPLHVLRLTNLSNFRRLLSWKFSEFLPNVGILFSTNKFIKWQNFLLPFKRKEYRELLHFIILLIPEKIPTMWKKFHLPKSGNFHERCSSGSLSGRPKFLLPISIFLITPVVFHLPQSRLWPL